MMHSLHGNGGKGKGQGKNRSKGGALNYDYVDPEEAQRRYAEDVRVALPEAAQLRAQPALMAEEWSAEVVPFQHLTSKGGVAILPKAALPEVLARVGYTAKPTAVLMVQDPDEVGLVAYPRAKVVCTLSVVAQGGERMNVQAQRWLVQLGFADMVKRVVEGEAVEVSLHMIRMVAKFSTRRGWPEGPQPAAALIAQLVGVVPEQAVDGVQPRADGSVTFGCHKGVRDAVLRASGKAGVFYKNHKEQGEEETYELLWLPKQTDLDEARKMAADRRTCGLVEKGKTGLLAL
eukprot:12821351-Heterocapsa_arctica.AAC.1